MPPIEDERCNAKVMHINVAAGATDAIELVFQELQLGLV
jgi:hypothetical protein